MARRGSAIDRRTFLELGTAASAAALAGCGGSAPPPGAAPAVTLRRRPLGATGLDVSEVSFGAHGTRQPGLLVAAVEAGMNLVMTSGSYLDGREEEAVGQALRALGARRDGVVVVTGEAFGAEAGRREAQAAIDASLRRLGTDRIDVYCTFMVQTEADVRRHEVLAGIEEARRAGKVIHVGLSGHHGGLERCLRAATADGVYGAFFVRYDFVSYPGMGEVLHEAAQRGIGTVVFKTTAGARQREIADLERGGLSFPHATFKWALRNPDVASVLVSIESYDQIRALAAALGTPLTAAEATMLRRYADAVRTVYCRSCAACEASCPHGVAIADVNRYAMYFEGYRRERDAMLLYDRLAPGRTAAGCERCPGPCDAACPFGRHVRDGLLAAHRLLALPRA